MDYNQEPAEPLQQTSFPNVSLPPEDQALIVAKCLAFKSEAVKAWRLRKEKMKTSYAYFMGEFVGGDMLPQPQAQGSEKDAQARTQIFMPISKQIAVQLYAGMKLSLFPDDENYFAIKSKSGENEAKEKDLQRAVELKLKESEFTEKFGQVLLNLIIFGCTVSQPVMNLDKASEWRYNPLLGSYELFEYDLPPVASIQVMNPIQFYPDPSIQFSDKSKWAYLDNKKKQEILDSPFYLNKKAVEALNIKETRSNDKTGDYPDLGVYSGLTNTFNDSEDNVKYDLYYFPLLKCNGKEYRNFLCGVVENTILVRFQPNPYPRGKNPVVFTEWRPDPHSPIGDGPLDDIQEIQKQINIYQNYNIDVMAKAGNRFVIRDDVDMSQAFGAACQIIRAQDPVGAVVPLIGNLMEPQLIQNMMGVLKAEAQIMTGSNQPFQGSSEVDFKKTATELKITQENSVTIAREILEHVGIKCVKPLIERFCYMLGSIGGGAQSFRVDDEGVSDRLVVDFSDFLTDDYSVEITTINPAQSKQAQTEILMQILEMVNSGGSLAGFIRDGGYQTLKRVAELQGLKGMEEIFYSPRELAEMQQQQMEQQQQMMAMQQQQGME